MGGGIETVTRTKNTSEAYDDLKIVHCTVDLISGKHILFDRTLVFKKMNRDAEEYFEHYGVKFEIGRIAGLGGGGIATLFEVIKTLWAKKEIIGIAFTVFKHLYNFLIKPLEQDKPHVRVSLWIQTDADMLYVRDHDLNWVVRDALVNLQDLSDGLKKSLKKKYPIFVFDQTFGVYIHNKNYKAYYSLFNEQDNSFNRYRLTLLFKKLKIMSNSSVEIRFNKWFLIERFDAETEFHNGLWLGDRNRKKSVLLN